MAIRNRNVAKDAKIEYRKFAHIVEAKTADYTVTNEDMGKIFTTRGAAGAVDFTLPAASDDIKGQDLWFMTATTSGNMTVTSAEGGNIVTFNDIGANSVAFTTVAEKAGGAFHVISDGSDGWLVFTHLADETQTISITT